MNLLNLPNELLVHIFYHLDLDDLRTCLCVNKSIHAILNPQSSSLAQHCFRGFRRRINFPDPAVFNLTETSFFGI